MDALMGRKVPPGIRFHPTDEELFMFYLKRKVLGKSLGPQLMSEVDVYRFAPWELPEKACLKTGDLNWYFLCPRSKKYPNGGRANRATIHGYWKSTGIDRTANYKNRPVGKIKTLIFHRGKAPKGDRTDWVMHEYRLEDQMLLERGVAQDSYVICKIYKKSGLGPKNGENYGAPFVEEEWDFDDDNEVESNRGFANENAVSQPLPVDVANSPIDSAMTKDGHNHVGPSTPSTMQQPLCAPVVELPQIETKEDELDRLLALFTESEGSQSSVPLTEDEIFNGLDDLPAGTSIPGECVDWSQYFLDEGYIEMKDLQD